MTMTSTSSSSSHRTPLLALDPAAAVRAYEELREGLAGITVHYAVKCQPAAPVLAALAAAGAGFEVASAAEIAVLSRLGVDPAGLVFSHPVKPPADIHAAAAAGVRLYAFDSTEELTKIATAAPGASVMVRLATSAGSEVASEGKFGVDPVTAATLLLAAREQGLDPAGVAFHVGSQCIAPESWIQPIEDAGAVMRAVQRHGVRLRLLDVGGGFPTRYAGAAPPPIERYGQVIGDALESLLPHPVERVLAEPGRAIAAPAGTMVTTVIGVARRGGVHWAHLDAGAFHGFAEALETGCGIPWPVADSRGDTARATWTLTGPSCDSQDTIARDVELSAGLTTGDRVLISAAGAYTTTYTDAAGFNGFPAPELVTLTTDTGGGHGADPRRAVDLYAGAADGARTALAEYAATR